MGALEPRGVASCRCATHGSHVAPRQRHRYRCRRERGVGTTPQDRWRRS